MINDCKYYSVQLWHSYASFHYDTQRFSSELAVQEEKKWQPTYSHTEANDTWTHRICQYSGYSMGNTNNLHNVSDSTKE